ncbi:centromere protein T isoform X2 [Pyrgilauda ruficollis]|uniref:centromere protein T isoform X2 n=1 Tax=Pyrgilauda ruficollis TaxID=221976 RepID=UPI001B864F2A|nr:centromere protein T isoform X2 [Pyrgilauda ruficollis]
MRMPCPAGRCCGVGRAGHGGAAVHPISALPGTAPRAAEAPGWRAPRRAGRGQPSEAVALAGAGAGGVEQPVLLADLLAELGLGQAQATDAALHLLHLHLQQRDDVALLVQLPQQLLRRGARRQRVRVIGGAALRRALLPRRRRRRYRHRQPHGAGPDGGGGPELHLHRQVDGLHVLGRAPCRGLGGGRGALRGGGGGGGGAGAPGPLSLALVDAAQREDGGDPHQTGLSVQNKSKSVSSTLAKQRLAVFPDLRNGTPRLMLKRVMQNQPQVSPLAPQISNHEDTQEAHAEVPPKRASSTGELQLPDVAPEDTSVTVFHMKKKRKKLSISEFERAAERRLPQYQAQSTLDSTIMARSLHMSVGSLLAPDTVEKRGLLRRPKTRRAVDMQAFEGRVEQNMLKSKGQNDLVDSQSASGIRTSILTSDAEMMMNSTELFVQPQLDEESQNKLSALESQLSDSKASAQRSLISDADQEEARLEGLVPSVSTNQGRTQRYSKSSNLDDEHVDRMTHVSPESPAKQEEEKQDHSQQNNPAAQISYTEEEVVCSVYRWSSSLPSKSSSTYLGSPVTLNVSRMYLRQVVSHIIEDLEVSDTEEEMINTENGVEQEQIFPEAAEHGASARYSEHLEKKLAEKAELQITAAQDSRGEAERAPSAGEELEEGSTGAHGSPRAEHEITRGIGAGSLGRHSHASSSLEKPEMTQLNETDEQGDELQDEAMMLNFENSVEEAAEDEAEHPPSEEVSMKTPAFVRAPAKNLLSTPRVAKPAAPRSPLQLLQPKKVSKRLGTSKKKPREPQVPRSLIKEIFRHFAKVPVTRDAFQIVEKWQGLVTDKMPLTVLIERYLPMEYRRLLIPVAVSGNKVIPCK